MILNRIKSIALVNVLAITLACASFPTHVLNYGQKAQTSLEMASFTADEAVKTGLADMAWRQNFAKLYMLPATTALEETIKIAQAYKSGDPIPSQLLLLIRLITDAIQHVSMAVKDGLRKQELLINLNTVKSESESLQSKMGGS